ncbi:hypothetical protein GM658_24740 [Pseudoduganella eburnea]|uniref:Uncharacterized protein n=1 Tax=Massilia eburnea TaxID=1776165 RepID=A0A6L6QNZ8_9BURK|nr:hypothetical protein [Massilia eburnea]MTW13824.1 hypothetical protein [Massilia eburnea]
MKPFLFSLPASFETYQGLGNFMCEQGIKQEMYELVDSIVKEWMERFLDRQAHQSASTLDGYQWKCLFLPNGTTLRTVYKRKSYLAHVEGSELRFEGRCVSPGQFVDEVAHCPRNAWRTIWLRYPNEVEWKQAMTLRMKTTDRETKRDAGRPKK